MDNYIRLRRFGMKIEASPPPPFIFFLALLSILELFCHFANLKCKNGSG